MYVFMYGMPFSIVSLSFNVYIMDNNTLRLDVMLDGCMDGYRPIYICIYV